MYIKIINLLATGFYAGYLPKAPGTWGSLLALLLYWLIFRHLPVLVYGWFIGLVLLLGIFVSGEYDRLHNTQDAAEIVIDEVAGQSLALLPLFGWNFAAFYPAWSSLLALILFRCFDIAKPFGVNRLQDLHGGFGVMLDDVLAGLYAALVWLAVMLGVVLWPR
ncbi:MAG: phosphatidylglycerophosphatase A [Candidatus Margulisbacteria bacterium]|jgi:phosphatidylglycerophosphatase A|nr:phosphatidylglycerophosphatase A [Candidatus Margulisiibacteriota bacterium]